jgi:hypothetical protein
LYGQAQIRITELEKRDEEKDIQINLLKLQIVELRKFIFGGKQEKFTPNTHNHQVDLFPQEKLADVTVTTQEKIVTTKTITVRPNHKGRNPLPSHLRREEIILEPTECNMMPCKISCNCT